jgi:hypothetical protein
MFAVDLSVRGVFSADLFRIAFIFAISAQSGAILASARISEDDVGCFFSALLDAPRDAGPEMAADSPNCTLEGRGSAAPALEKRIDL